MSKFYGFIQPKIGWLYDHSDKYWVQVGSGNTYDLAREDTLRVIREMNKGKANPVQYVMSIRTHEEVGDGV